MVRDDGVDQLLMSEDAKAGCPEIKGNLDSVRVLNGERGPVLCVVAGGQITMYRLPASKLAALMESGFTTIRERIE